MNKWWLAALSAYLSPGVLTAYLIVFYTNISYSFAAFMVVGWPVWLVAAYTDNLWLVDWLPADVWTLRK